MAWLPACGILLLLTVLGFGLYWNIIDSEFHLDDYPNLVDNPSVHLTRLDGASLHRALTASVGGNRPVAALLFALNFRAGQFNVSNYHVTSIICHILAGLMLFLFLRRTLRLPQFAEGLGRHAGLAALLGTLVWFAHPIQTQAVTYIIQRANVLAGLFTFAALYLYAVLRTTRPGAAVRMLQWAGLLLCGLLALGSKETAAVLPLVILLYELFFFLEFDFSRLRKEPGWLAGLTVAASTIVLAPALILVADRLRFGVWLSERMDAIFQLRGFTMWERVLTQFRVLVEYITLLILPLPGRLNLEHDVAVSRSLFDPLTTVFSLLFLAGLLALGAWLARRRPLISFFIFWFFLQLAVESSIVPLELMFEHRLYIPSVSLAVILVVLLLDSLSRLKGRVPGTMILLAVVVIFSVFTVQRNAVWKTELSLLEDAAAKSPEKARIFSNLARTHYLLAESETTPEGAMARIDRVEQYARQALGLDPTLLDAHVHLGNAYAYKAQASAAFAETRDLAAPFGDLAIDAFSRAISINPEYPDAHVNLGLQLARQGLKEEAIEEYRLAIELNPMHLKARNNLGNVYQSQQKYQLAIEQYTYCLDMYDGMPEVHNNLANSYLALKRYAEAEQHYLKAIELFKDFGIAHTNLAMAYLEQGKVKEAKFHIEEALRIDPNNTTARSMVTTVPLRPQAPGEEAGAPRRSPGEPAPPASSQGR